MAKNRRDRLRTGLEKMGYTRRINFQSSKWYEYVPGPGCAAPLLEGPHRILVGKQRAVRYTRGLIEDSHALAPNMVERILEQV